MAVTITFNLKELVAMAMDWPSNPLGMIRLWDDTPVKEEGMMNVNAINVEADGAVSVWLTWEQTKSETSLTPTLPTYSRQTCHTHAYPLHKE